MNYQSLATVVLALAANFACTKNMKARDPQESMVKTAKVTMTASFKTVGDLPRCDAGSETMSAYISQRDVFVKCQSSFWRDVKPGDTTGRYVARNSIRFNEWTDTSTKRRWSLPKQAELALADVSPNVCSAGWKLPTQEELVQASSNGLFEGLKSHGGLAFDKAWTDNLDAITGVSKGAMASILPKTSDLTAGVYCVASN